MTYLLALDQGTTSSRAILFDASGVPQRSAQYEFEQFYPCQLRVLPTIFRREEAPLA